MNKNDKLVELVLMADDGNANECELVDFVLTPNDNNNNDDEGEFVDFILICD